MSLGGSFLSSDRVPDELWMEVRDIVQERGIKTIPKKTKCKKAKRLSEEALQIAVKRREMKSKGEKERYSHLNAEFQRIVRRDKKAFLSDQFSSVAQLCLALCDPRDGSPPGSLVPGILQARILEWVAIEISSHSHSIIFLYFLALIMKKSFLSLLAILWYSLASKWVYFSFSPLLFSSLLFSAIFKASSDSRFAFLHFFLS